ncbi:hypothetical protein Q5C_07200 [Leuconostoc pseudomesenteroides 4882]|nr:hypothetical protein L964_1412 [Leuconostoc pseudomesenteroides 1159]CCJ66736.1 hypothetical protein Q5C_07200 [Leuconostoc pseudomesenteroides 4882]
MQIFENYFDKTEELDVVFITLLIKENVDVIPLLEYLIYCTTPEEAKK